MRTTFLTLFILFQFPLLHAQILKRTTSFKVSKISVREAIEKLSEQENFDYSYPTGIINEEKVIHLQFEREEIQNILKQIIQNPEISLKERRNQIFFRHHPKIKKRTISSSNILKGYIREANTGLPIANAKVSEKQTNLNTSANSKGYFNLKIDNPNQVLRLKIIAPGYQTKKINLKLNTEKSISVTLEKHLRDSSTLSPLKSISPTIVQTPSFYDKKKLALQKLEKKTDEDTLKVLPLNIGICPPLDLNNLHDQQAINNFSFNLLYNSSAGIDGIGISSLFNFYNYNSNGLQLAGLGNYTAGNIRGVSLGGLFNVALQSTTGFQFAGICNLSFNSLYGMQYAGIANLIDGEVYGIQFAGIYNHISKESYILQFSGIANQANNGIIQGAQVAGIVNSNWGELEEGAQISGIVNLNKRKINGAQIAGVANIANDTIDGVQIAPFNKSKVLNGLQIGVLNIADTIESGVSIGLFNYIKKGLRQLELEYNSNGFYSLHVKSGSSMFYNIIGVGLKPDATKHLPRISYGIGTQFSFFKSTHLNLELIQSVQENHLTDELDEVGLSVAVHLKLRQGITKHISLFGGVSSSFLNNYSPGLTEINTDLVIGLIFNR